MGGEERMEVIEMLSGHVRAHTAIQRTLLLLLMLLLLMLLMLLMLP